MSGATFGRKVGGPDPDLAARRAAFLAAERARPRQDARPDEGFTGPRPSGRALLPPKSMFRAYMHWFFGGGLSAHRFYLGFPASAIIQLMLTPISYVLLINKSPAGLMVASAATLWLLTDAFLIPGLLRRANERGRGSSLASTFE
jgi:TM2 domain-containing membrane protein YozV